LWSGRVSLAEALAVANGERLTPRTAAPTLPER
jgi:hypothetical protein